MQHPHDHIIVGMITLPYSGLFHGWLLPDGAVIKNPIAAQNAAEHLNNASKTVH
ncbi:DUF1317 family protein [Pantoea cypripedii]|uniref:Cruciferin n=1 Tax=Pantoea cypripedii TaxID=55209 RepID=A0A1X1ET44_PANCY|nr:DUF1317 family protein [Pantoea cypripedii]MBP2197190.1 hypothetical protein [Pantoea cypripedii]ORM93121.1 cruciferin [Pantoea cypripedii]